VVGGGTDGMTAVWEPLFRTTIDAYYRDELVAGRDACERLLSLPALPDEIDLHTRRNRVFYTPRLSELAPSFRPTPLTIPVRDGWTCYNPSVAAGPDGDLWAIVRSANYETSPTLDYTVHDPDGIVRTENSLVALGPDLVPREIRQIDDRAFRPEPPAFLVAGFEDCRLVWHRGAWWASATVRDRTPDGTCQIALLRLEGAVAREERLLSDGVSRHEKNWMPVAAGDDILRFVYSTSPTVLLRYDDETGIVLPEREQLAPPVARAFSGGSQVVPFDDGWLCLIHESVRFDDGGRVYTHRWLWFDAEWRLTLLSPPFIFLELGVEFAAGLTRRGDELVVSYGVWDREAWLATVALAEVRALLAPPLDPGAVAAELSASSGAPTEGVSVSLPAPAADRGAAEAGITPFAVRRPVIVSTTLTGNNADIIADALRSAVEWVDWCLVIDTGVTDDTLDVAHQIAGDKLVVRQFPWRDDFAAARNFALDAAAELGADWAITLDSDERLEFGEIDLHAALAAATADSFHVKHVNGTYGKERVFRLPVRGRYVGPTHEAFIRATGGTETLEGVLFDELGKTLQQYRRKAERDIAILTRHTAEHPSDPRWFYYLGDSLAGLGRYDEAIAAFRRCASLDGWDEEGGWAMYRAAECLLKLDRPGEAVTACAAGLARHAGLAELSWMAAYASWHAGRPHQAVYWARQSVAMGHFAGAGASVPRIGFRHPPALWEGPYDVLRFAFRATGDETGAAEAERLYHEAKAAREAEGMGEDPS
jgi:tetratricopeptide (TPR) repeat protein